MTRAAAVPAAQAPPHRPADPFTGRHVLSMAQYGPADLTRLFEVADAVGALPDRALAGRVLVSAFFERSTRTRLAHETAMLRLGGGVTGFADPDTTRAGGRTREAADDIARMVSLYGDVAVVRHPETGWPARMASRGHGALVINGGDGTGEHPTQAMVDLYTMWRLFGDLRGLRVLVTNDLRMRCVHSLVLGLRCFGATVYGVAAPGKAPADGDVPGLALREDLRSVLPEVDVVYSSPTVAAEAPGADDGRAVVLDPAVLSRHAAAHTVVLHPLPRRHEVPPELDDTRFNAYWAQAANGVPVRMALLGLVLDALP